MEKSDREVATVMQLPLPSRAEDMQTPFSSKALFWRPHHAVESPALAYLPFLFWLVETGRPRTVFQAGLGDGVVYMALCQAVERLSSGAMCLGVQTDEPLLPQDMLEVHERCYLDFSEVRAGDPKAIASSFGGEIDLLVFNQAVGCGASADLEKEWLPYLSDRAVILICDSVATATAKTPRGRQATRRTRSLTLGPICDDGYSVEITLHGSSHPERLAALASQRPGDPGYLTTRQVFNRLGQGLAAIYRNERLQKEREISANEAVSPAVEKSADRRKASKQREEFAELTAQLEHARAEHELRIEDIAVLTEAFSKDLEKAKQDNVLLAAKAASHEARIKELEALLRVRDLEIKTEGDSANRIKAEAEHAIRQRELRVGELANKLESANVEVERLREALLKLHKIAAEEIGRAIKILLSDRKSSLWSKKNSIADRAKLLVETAIVEPGWYLERYPDVAAAGMNPAQHYLLHGAHEGRFPRRQLDEAAKVASPEN